MKISVYRELGRQGITLGYNVITLTEDGTRTVFPCETVEQAEQVLDRLNTHTDLLGVAPVVSKVGDRRSSCAKDCNLKPGHIGGCLVYPVLQVPEPTATRVAVSKLNGKAVEYEDDPNYVHLKRLKAKPPRKRKR